MNVIPLPNVFQSLPGSFHVHKDTTINFSGELKATADLLCDFLAESIGSRPKRSNYSSINLTLDFSLEEEQYQLFVDRNSVHLSARTNRGAFYGLQTLKQLATVKDGRLFIDCCIIDDRPRFSYRGFMLDVARHFFPKEEIFRLIDLIAFHKFNVFHLHLTDDQGWRIESEAYPRLTEIGGKRKATYSRRLKGYAGPHQGYYTKADLKEIVAYARSRHIEIIPEIDMPGHMNAFIAAYPDASCLNKEIDVLSDFGISDITLCPGNKEVYQMLSQVILELIDIFDGPYFHLGGDEVPKKHWKKCPRCQKAIKDFHLKNEKELATHFLNYFAEFLRAHNKTPIFWNDGISEKTSHFAVVQHWKYFTRKKTVKEINRGRRAVLSDYFYLYLDLPYALTPLKKTYQFEPLGKKIKNTANVLGIEAPLWTEWVPDRSKIDFQIFPRLAAVAEIAWTEKENKSYDDFIERLKNLYSHYRKMNVGFAEDKENQPNLFARAWGALSWFQDEDCELRKKKRRR